MDDAASPATATDRQNQLADQYLLCVDGAGVFLLCLGNEITIGGLRDDDNRADVCVMSDLARKHVTLVRSQGGYLLEPHGFVTFQDRELSGGESVPLGPSEKWTLGESVEIQFRRPNVLSLTAVLDFPTSHRPTGGQPTTSIDRVILMDQNCLIGPGNDQHVQLHDSEDRVVLYKSKGRLWCKSKNVFRANDQVTTTTCTLHSGDVIAGDDYRFRIEAA